MNDSKCKTCGGSGKPKQDEQCEYYDRYENKGMCKVDYAKRRKCDLQHCWLHRKYKTSKDLKPEIIPCPDCQQQPGAAETKGTCLSCGGSFFVDEQVHIGCVHTRCYWQNRQQPEPTGFTKEVRTVLGLPRSIPARLRTITDYLLEACDIIDRQAEDNKRLKEFALNLVDGDEEELKKLDYWVEEYLHAYEQLTKINEIEGENKQLKEHFENIVENIALKLCPECLSVIRPIWEQAKKGE